MDEAMRYYIARVAVLEKQVASVISDMEKMRKDHRVLASEVVGALKDESTRVHNETEAYVEDMQKSMSDIVDAVAATLTPYQETLDAMHQMNAATIKAIQQLDDAVKAVITISQPHADVVREIAGLINESVAGIRKTASAATQIISVELRDAVAAAVEEMKNAAE